DALELVDRVDDERPDARLDGGADLVAGLGDPVEDDLRRSETGALGLPQLAARVHLEVDAGAAHLVQEPQVRAGLAGKEDLGIEVASRDGVDHGADVPTDTAR